MSLVEVKVPDIGDFSDVPVIELFVKVGDTIKVDDAIATLESDKATMDVPASTAGVVKEVLVKLGDRIGEGAVVVRVEASDMASAAVAAAPAPAPASEPAPAAPQAAAPSSSGGVVDIKVPDIGDFAEVPVIEIFVKPGDSVKVDDALLTLESDKASMEIPAPKAGVIKSLKVKLGDRLKEGDPLLELQAADTQPATAASTAGPAEGRTDIRHTATSGSGAPSHSGSSSVS